MLAIKHCCNNTPVDLMMLIKHTSLFVAACIINNSYGPVNDVSLYWLFLMKQNGLFLGLHAAYVRAIFLQFVNQYDMLSNC